MENPVSFMADIVIVYIYVSTMNSYVYAYLHPQIPPVLQTSMYHPWMSILPGTPLSKYPWMRMWQCTSMDYPWIPQYVMVVSRDNPWMYIVTFSSTDTLTRGSQVIWTSMDDTWMSMVHSGGIQGWSMDDTWMSAVQVVSVDVGMHIRSCSWAIHRCTQ